MSEKDLDYLEQHRDYLWNRFAAVMECISQVKNERKKNDNDNRNKIKLIPGRKG